MPAGALDDLAELELLAAGAASSSSRDDKGDLLGGSGGKEAAADPAADHRNDAGEGIVKGSAGQSDDLDALAELEAMADSDSDALASSPDTTVSKDVAPEVGVNGGESTIAAAKPVPTLASPFPAVTTETATDSSFNLDDLDALEFLADDMSSEGGGAAATSAESKQASAAAPGAAADKDRAVPVDGPVANGSSAVSSAGTDDDPVASLMDLEGMFDGLASSTLSVGDAGDGALSAEGGSFDRSKPPQTSAAGIAMGSLTETTSSDEDGVTAALPRAPPGLLGEVSVGRQVSARPQPAVAMASRPVEAIPGDRLTTAGLALCSAVGETPLRLAVVRVLESLAAEAGAADDRSLAFYRVLARALGDLSSFSWKVDGSEVASVVSNAPAGLQYVGPPGEQDASDGGPSADRGLDREKARRRRRRRRRRAEAEAREALLGRQRGSGPVAEINEGHLASLPLSMEDYVAVMRVKQRYETELDSLETRMRRAARDLERIRADEARRNVAEATVRETAAFYGQVRAVALDQIAEREAEIAAVAAALAQSGDPANARFLDGWAETGGVPDSLLRPGRKKEGKAKAKKKKRGKKKGKIRKDGAVAARREAAKRKAKAKRKDANGLAFLPQRDSSVVDAFLAGAAAGR